MLLLLLLLLLLLCGSNPVVTNICYFCVFFILSVLFPANFKKMNKYAFVCLFVCFVALRPKSTAMVMAGRSVHLTILFPGEA